MVNFSRLLNEFSVNSFDLSHHGPVSSLFHGITDKVCGAQHCMAQKENALRSLLERFDQVGDYLFSQAVSS